MAALDANSRRQIALDAIAAVAAGAKAGDVETETVDFKEEAGTVSATGRRPIDAHHEPAAQSLACEVACMANSEHGGVLVVGVHDKASGPAAFVGTFLDVSWLQKRIFQLTTPSLPIDIPEVVEEGGKKLYLLNVQPALEPVRCGGKLRRRLGTDCVELDGNAAREFLESRMNYDWSAEPSPMRFSDCMPEALTAAHAYYRETDGVAAPSDLELLRRLEVICEDSDDPRLNQAGALLFCNYEPNVERLDILIAAVEGAASLKREIFKAPVIVAFNQAWDMIESAFPPQRVFVGPQRREDRSINQRALREALVNAVIHRDYRLPHASVLVLATGQPDADTFKVSSPGGFPTGVDAERLLATRSLPRNRVLADVMRKLGLAEREGVGISVMYLTLLRDGHPAPEIFSEGADVVCILHGGNVDRDVRAFFDALAAKDAHFGEDVRAHIAITQLFGQTPLRVEALARAAQCTDEEALTTLRRLTNAGCVERLLDGSRSFRLTQAARTALQSRITYRKRSTLDEQWDALQAEFDKVDELGTPEIALKLHITERQAGNVTRDLKNLGRITPVGAARGRGVRYKLAKQ